MLGQRPIGTAAISQGTDTTFVVAAAAALTKLHGQPRKTTAIPNGAAAARTPLYGMGLLTGAALQAATTRTPVNGRSVLTGLTASSGRSRLPLTARLAGTLATFSTARALSTLTSRPTQAPRTQSAGASRSPLFGRALQLPSIFSASRGRLNAGQAKPALGYEFGALWDPRDEPGLAEWFAAADLPNAGVDQWVGRLQGVAALPSSAVRNTKTATAFLGAYPGVIFTGAVGSWMQANNIGQLPTGNNRIDLYAVISQNDLTNAPPYNASYIFGYGNAISGFTRLFRIGDNNSTTQPLNFEPHDGTQVINDTSVSPLQGAHLLHASFNSIGSGEIRGHIDGSATTPATTLAFSNPFKPTQLVIGGHVANPVNGNEPTAVLVDLLIGTLSDAIVQKLDGFFAWKYGLVAQLPIGHPYKLTPPLATSDAQTVQYGLAAAELRGASAYLPTALQTGRSRLPLLGRALGAAATAALARGRLGLTTRPAQLPTVPANGQAKLGSLYGRAAQLPTIAAIGRTVLSATGNTRKVAIANAVTLAKLGSLYGRPAQLPTFTALVRSLINVVSRSNQLPTTAAVGRSNLTTRGPSGALPKTVSAGRSGLVVQGRDVGAALAAAATRANVAARGASLRTASSLGSARALATLTARPAALPLALKAATTKLTTGGKPSSFSRATQVTLAKLGSTPAKAGAFSSTLQAGRSRLPVFGQPAPLPRTQSSATVRLKFGGSVAFLAKAFQSAVGVSSVFGGTAYRVTIFPLGVGRLIRNARQRIRTLRRR